MAEIKGLQVDVSMDTTKFEQGYANIKRSMATFNTVLKTTRNQLKYNEKTQEGFKNHMNNLKGAIENSEKNIEQLGKAYDSLSEKQKQGVKGNQFISQLAKEQDNLRRLRNELHETEMTYASTFTTMGKISQSFKSIGSGLQGVGQKAQDMGGKLTKGITKPALIAGGALAGIAITKGFGRLVEIDTAKAKLSALGNSAKDTNTIMDNALESVKGTSFGMGEAATTAANAVAAGIKPGKELTQYLTNTADAAAIAGADMSEMGSIMNKVQTQNKAYNGELQQLSDRGLPVYQWLAKEAHVSAEEVTEMASKGEISSKMLQNAIKHNIGGAAKEMGQKSFTAALANMWAALARVGAAFLDAGGKGGGFFSKLKPLMNKLTDTFDNMGPQAEQWGVALGNVFGKVIDGITGIVKWYQGLDSGTQKVFGGIAKWLAITLVAVGPLLTVFGKLATVTGGMFTTFGQLAGGIGKVAFASKEAGSLLGGLTQVFPKLGAVVGLFANPVGLVIAGIVALGAAFVIAYKKSETFRNIVNGALQGVVDGFQFLWNGIKAIGSAIAAWWNSPTGIGGVLSKFWTENGPMLIQAFQNILNVAKPIFMALWNVVTTVFNGVKTVIVSVMQAVALVLGPILQGIKQQFINIWNLIKATTINVFNLIKGVIQGALNVILGIVKIFGGILTGDWRAVWDGIKMVGLGIMQVFVSALKFLFNQLLAFFKFIGASIKNVIVTSFQVMKGIVLGIVNILVQTVQAIFKGFVAVIKFLFTSLLSGVKVIWNAIKFAILTPIRATTTIAKKLFALLKNAIIQIFKTIKSNSSAIWNAIKNTIVNLVKGLVSGVRNLFTTMKNSITAIFNAVKNFSIKVWNTIKNSVINLARGLWNGVRSAFNALKKGTTDIMNSVGGFMSKKWKDIKNGTVNLVTGMKDKVTGVMNKMGDAIKSVTGKIKGFFNGMIKGVKKGLNTLIKGVNWVGDKLGMKKLPEVKLHTGTESTHTQSFVTNGKINRDTFATVGDKGRGNGPNGFRHEMIRYPNGKMALTPNRDTTAFLPKGSSVMNGAQTHSMLSNLPKFSFGTNPLGNGNPKPKKKKKGDNLFGDAWDATKAGAAKVVDGGKAVVSKVGETVGKGKKWLEGKIGDVMDWIEKPGKLLDKVLEGFGLNLDSFGISKKAKLPYDMMKGMFSNLKKAAVDKIKQAFEEQEGDGDGGYIDLWRGINFGFAATAAEAARQGYPFARAHHGLDINYPYGTKVRSTVSGKATGTHGYNGGFGNMMKIVSGALEVIYGHMSKLNWTGTKSVKPGTLLGLSGGDPARQGAGAGSSTGPHLHYEMRKNGVAFDPTSWLKKNNGSGKGGSQNKAASKWKGDIKRAAKKMKVNLSGSELNGIVAQIQRESNGNAGVTQGNIGDINNLRGTPAQGLLQYVPSTFDSYKLKGYGNIKNGYHQLLAFFNNSNWRRDLPYGRSGWSPTGSRRFASGGLINESGWYNLAEGGYPEIVVPMDPAKASDAMKLIAIASERVSQRAKNNKRPNQLRMPSTSNTNDNEMINFMARQLEATQRQVELLTQLVASSQRLEQKPTGVSEKKLSQQQAKRLSFETYSLGGSF